MNTFQQKLAAFSAALDAVPIVVPTVSQAVEQNDLFDLHLRSLPVGIDKPVAFSITKDEALQLLRSTLKARVQASHGTERVLYYDLIPIGATEAERSVYYNPPWDTQGVVEK